MREVYFVNKNREKWRKFEESLNDKSKFDPDELAGLYVESMDDLAFARTFFPKTKTVSYLNQLTAKIHQEIFRNKKEDSKRLITFWTREIPQLFSSAQRYLLASFIILILGSLIGIISSANDDSFVRLILGDGYVNMTLENIKTGDPMAVYKSSAEVPMFLGITFNNIRVSFLAFVLGVFFSVGTAYILFQNAVMLGSFMYFFYKYGLLFLAFRTIWIHGTLEISAITIAGAAGFIIGNSILFPGTYSRRESFMRGAKKGIKIVVALVPMFIVAGFLESFVTRHNGMPPFLSLIIIGLSLAFVLWYFVFLPLHLKRNE
jgi:uncharacterized membrane protein SpoIIM required for sporulation